MFPPRVGGRQVRRHCTDLAVFLGDTPPPSCACCSLRRWTRRPVYRPASSGAFPGLLSFCLAQQLGQPGGTKEVFVVQSEETVPWPQGVVRCFLRPGCLLGTWRSWLAAHHTVTHLAPEMDFCVTLGTRSESARLCSSCPFKWCAEGELRAALYPGSPLPGAWSCE